MTTIGVQHALNINEEANVKSLIKTIKAIPYLQITRIVWNIEIKWDLSRTQIIFKILIKARSSTLIS